MREEQLRLDLTTEHGFSWPTPPEEMSVSEFGDKVLELSNPPEILELGNEWVNQRVYKGNLAPVPHGYIDPLGYVAVNYIRTRASERPMQRIVNDAIKNGADWQDIADALSVTPEVARERWAPKEVRRPTSKELFASAKEVKAAAKRMKVLEDMERLSDDINKTVGMVASLQEYRTRKLA